MNNLTNNPSKSSPVSKRVAVLSMIGIAVCNAVSGIIQVTDEQSSQTTVVGIEHITIGCLTVTLLLLIPVMFYLSSLIGSRKGAIITTVGCIALAALSTTSNIRGEDYGFFAAVAVPSNLAITAGFIVTAVGLRRRTDVSLALAVSLPLMWFVALPLSAIGGGLLVAAWWGAVAWMTEHDRIRPKATSTHEIPAQAKNQLAHAA